MLLNVFVASETAVRVIEKDFCLFDEGNRGVIVSDRKFCRSGSIADTPPEDRSKPDLYL